MKSKIKSMSKGKEDVNQTFTLILILLGSAELAEALLLIFPDLFLINCDIAAVVL